MNTRPEEGFPVELPDPEAPRVFFSITPHFYGKCWVCKQEHVEIVSAAFTKPAELVGWPRSAPADYWCFIFCKDHSPSPVEHA